MCLYKWINCTDIESIYSLFSYLWGTVGNNLGPDHRSKLLQTTNSLIARSLYWSPFMFVNCIGSCSCLRPRHSLHSYYQCYAPPKNVKRRAICYPSVSNLKYHNWTKNIYRIDAHLWGESPQKEIGVISQLGAEKITFPPKPDGRTDGHK